MGGTKWYLLPCKKQQQTGSILYSEPKERYTLILRSNIRVSVTI